MGTLQAAFRNLNSLDACPPLEQAVVEFIQGFTSDSMNPEVRIAVSRLVRDQVAVQIGSSRLPWSRKILSFTTARRVPGTSSVIANDVKMSAVDAAFVNATFGHGFEYDDAHRASASHPGCCVIPAALALGEELNATLDEVVAAIVVGYEVYTRIGCMAAPDLLKRGFHPHAVLSTFGAAAVASKLRNFNAETTLNALAIALSHASGTGEFTSTGGSVKRVHSGIGTKNGMLSAEMAQAGITGPRAFLSGKKGFFKTFLQRDAGVEPERWFGLGQEFQITKVWLKPYCCCGCIHAYIDVCRRYGGRVDDIATVTLKIQRSANVVVGTVNANVYMPKNIEHVQFSLPIQMAFALLGLGNGYQVHLDYLEGKVNMDAVVKVASLITIIETPELDEAYPGKFVADVTVNFKNGTLERVFVEDSLGTIQNPIPELDHDAKFMELTSGVLGSERATALLAALRTLRGSMPVAELTEMLTV